MFFSHWFDAHMLTLILPGVFVTKISLQAAGVNSLNLNIIYLKYVGRRLGEILKLVNFQKF